MSNYWPSWRYHSDGRALVVNTPVEEAALGEGWAESPAAFAASTPPAVDQKPAVADPIEDRAPRPDLVDSPLQSAFDVVKADATRARRGRKPASDSAE